MFNKMEAFMNEIDSDGDVTVYTCKYGFDLFEKGGQFNVWHEQFKEDGDYRLLVPFADLSLDEDGDVYVVDTINVRVSL